MNHLYLLAAGLSALTFCVHTFVGQRYVVAPFQAESFSPFSKATLEVAWHMVTWTLAVMSGLLVMAATGWGGLGPVVAVLAAGYALVFIAVAQRSARGLIWLPQWILLGSVAYFSLAGFAAQRWPEAHVARLAACVLLVAIAALHLLWAFGVSWPARDRHRLGLSVVGSSRGVPRRAACLVVVTALAAMAWLLAVDGPGWAQLGVAVVFVARGTAGFIERWLRPSIRGTPYEQYSAFMYTPLSLGIGIAVWLGR